uniref:Uncharacterized protein n=1 Tax=Spongospora subterranea TaxID=70186 RepID=A0A0H5QTG4_9EUKA|eukprot:CRZ05220.1 hypothetical protein [Spongospora subterranea]
MVFNYNLIWRCLTAIDAMSESGYVISGRVYSCYAYHQFYPPSVPPVIVSMYPAILPDDMNPDDVVVKVGDYTITRKVFHDIVNFRFNSINPFIMVCPECGVQFSRHNPKNYLERGSDWISPTFLRHPESIHLMQWSTHGRQVAGVGLDGHALFVRQKRRVSACVRCAKDRPYYMMI